MTNIPTAKINDIFFFNQPINYLEYDVTKELRDISSDIYSATNNGNEPVVVLLRAVSLNNISLTKEKQDIINNYIKSIETFANDKMIVIKSDDDRLCIDNYYLDMEKNICDFIILLPEKNKIIVEDNFEYYANKFFIKNNTASEQKTTNQVDDDVDVKMAPSSILTQEEIDYTLNTVGDDEVKHKDNSLIAPYTKLIIDVFYKADINITSPLIKALIDMISGIDNKVVLRDILEYSLVALLKEHRDELVTAGVYSKEQVVTAVTMKDIIDKYVLVKI